MACNFILQDLRAAIKVNEQNAPIAHHAHTNVSPEEMARLQHILAQALRDSEECTASFLAEWPMMLTKGVFRPNLF